MDGFPVDTRKPLVVDARRCGFWLAATTASLGVVSYAMHLITRAVGADPIETLDVGDEVSLGTWYESLLFVVAAAALFLAGRQEPPSNRLFGWNSLAAVMAFLSIDEAASLHERFGNVLEGVIESGGYLHQLWVVPGVIFTVGVLLGHLGWLRRVPPATRRGMLVGGALFVLGAVGFELLAGPLAEAGDDDTLAMITLIAIEEFLEMIGLSVFILAVLGHLRGAHDIIEIR